MMSTLLEELYGFNVNVHIKTIKSYGAIASLGEL